MKWGGICLLLGAGTAIGFYKAYGFRRRIAEIIMLQNAFQLLETEIFYTLTPVPVAMEVLEEKLPRPYSVLSSGLVCYGAGAIANVSCMGTGRYTTGADYLLWCGGIGRCAQLWSEIWAKGI